MNNQDQQQNPSSVSSEIKNESQSSLSQLRCDDINKKIENINQLNSKFSSDMLINHDRDHNSKFSKRNIENQEIIENSNIKPSYIENILPKNGIASLYYQCWNQRLEELKPVENFKRNCSLMREEFKEMRQRNSEIWTKGYWSQHQDYVRHSLQSTIDYSREHVFNRQSIKELEDKDKMIRFYEEYKFQIIMLGFALSSYSLIKRQMKKQKLSNLNKHQKEQNFYQNMQKRFYGPMPSLSRSSYQRMTMDEMIYKYNMSISLAVFLFGYGISLSGHTLYQLFCKSHNIDKSSEDEEE
eukprot:403339191